METSKCNNGDRLSVIPIPAQHPVYTEGDSTDAPDPFPPQFLRQDDSPHSLATVLRRGLRGSNLELALVADDLLVHTALYHAKEHRLYSTVEFVVLRP